MSPTTSVLLDVVIGDQELPQELNMLAPARALMGSKDRRNAF